MWTHFDEEGRQQMVDVSGKAPNLREAWAEGWVRVTVPILEALQGHTLKKGDPFPVAELAGIQGAKQTWSLIPLCHPLRLDQVEVRCELVPHRCSVRILSHSVATEATGVEMEALMAVSVAALTLYDMCKGLDKGMVLESIRLLRKTGGKSGTWSCDGEGAPFSGEAAESCAS